MQFQNFIETFQLHPRLFLFNKFQPAMISLSNRPQNIINALVCLRRHNVMSRWKKVNIRQKQFRPHRYQLIWMIHHRDEQIQKHHNVYDRIAPKHQHAPEASENFYSIQLEAI